MVKFPSAALAPLHLAAWTRLTALARGFLTRRLMATERVQDLKRTIRETLSCAVQLHMEAGGAPNKQELDLHARLLAQLEAACADVHYIFFDLTVGERMVLLANDRAARQAKAQRLLDARKEEADKVKPRLSSATAARIAAKSKAPSPALARLCFFSLFCQVIFVLFKFLPVPPVFIPLFSIGLNQGDVVQC